MPSQELDVRVAGRVTSGHGVASGRGPDAPYPEGSLRLQLPRFAEMGLDLRALFPGTINVSTAPDRIVFARPTHRFGQVLWTTRHPPEDFSFVRCRLAHRGTLHAAWGYRPDPATKVEHFQSPDVIEVITERIDALAVGDEVVLELSSGEVDVVRGPTASGRARDDADLSSPPSGTLHPTGSAIGAATLRTGRSEPSSD